MHITDIPNVNKNPNDVVNFSYFKILNAGGYPNKSRPLYIFLKHV